MVLLVQIFCSLYLHGYSKQEKLIPAVHHVSILFLTDYIKDVYCQRSTESFNVQACTLPAIAQNIKTPSHDLRFLCLLRAIIANADVYLDKRLCQYDITILACNHHGR